MDAAHRRGAVVITPATLGVGLLEFHQIDRMVLAGREAARALLAEGSLDLGARAEPDVAEYVGPDFVAAEADLGLVGPEPAVG